MLVQGQEGGEGGNGDAVVGLCEGYRMEEDEKVRRRSVVISDDGWNIQDRKGTGGKERRQEEDRKREKIGGKTPMIGKPQTRPESKGTKKCTDKKYFYDKDYLPILSKLIESGRRE